MPIATGMAQTPQAKPLAVACSVLTFVDIAMAGVNMRLESGAIRELHWHQTAEVSMRAAFCGPDVPDANCGIA